MENSIRTATAEEFKLDVKGLLAGIDQSDIAVMDAEMVNQANKFDDPSLQQNHGLRNGNSLK